MTGCIAEAQRDGSLDPAADPAGLVVAVVRGVEALGKSNAAPEVVLQAVEQVIALLPRGPVALQQPGR